MACLGAYMGGTAGVGGRLANGDFMSTFTGGACEILAPQLKQNRASSVFGLPQLGHARIAIPHNTFYI